jgi:hypothetical protein
MPEEKLCPLCGDPANLNKSSKLTIEALLAERDLYRELVNNTSIHLAELKAEVERLKEHTWQEERKAVVIFLTKRYENTSYLEAVRIATEQFAEMVGRGVHWPEGGK